MITPPSDDQGALWRKRATDEEEWAKVQPYFLQRGYRLRPRYDPSWTPSWPPDAKYSQIAQAEDSVAGSLHPDIIDATRVSDGRVVVIKRTPSDTDEIDIARSFSSPKLRDDLRNHCVPVFDVFSDPEFVNMSFLVMPLLRPYSDPDFLTVGEYVEFVRQMLEGLVFMHLHNVAHRDGASANIMMDATHIFPEGYHPVAIDSPKDFSHRPLVQRTRSQAPVKYFFVDFGISSRFADRASRKFVLGQQGREKNVPELSNTTPYDPFAVDIFVAGKLVEEYAMQKTGLDFLAPMIAVMTKANPAQRPTADEAFAGYEKLRSSLSQRTLRSRLYSTQQLWITCAARS